MVDLKAVYAAVDEAAAPDALDTFYCIAFSKCHYLFCVPTTYREKSIAQFECFDFKRTERQIAVRILLFIFQHITDLHAADFHIC